MKKRPSFLLFLWMFFSVIGLDRALPQTRPSRLQSGIALYGEGKWPEAVIELRRAQAEAANTGQRAEALYWVSLAELAAGEYEAAVRDMDELIRIAPAGLRIEEIPYHKGRALYYLGRYDEAMVLLKAYMDALDAQGFNPAGDSSRKSAALYWMGECLYALGHLDKAGEMFILIVEQYPQSAKYEAASYRIALINQKKIETELLNILKWSHEESLKTVEEYQRRERSYDQAIIAYQKRIAEMLKDTRLAELENANADYQRRLAEAEARIAALQSSLTAAENTIIALRTNRTPQAPVPANPSGADDQTLRILSLKASALEVRNELMNQLNEQGSGEGAE
ncbi:MAG: tetratricopeptide repeat protein [Treponema sp.]|jgi:TolA-binding protein|nr:tetratricopeptide repeat protein [Treponema sp.]